VSALALASPSALRRYDALCALLARQGRGRTLSDLGAAWELAAALEEPGVDPGAVAELVASLGLDPGDIE
jgi:hypothetical protein